MSYIYRTSKVAARKRQNVSEWIGPGIVVGQEGKNFWVSQGSRCLLRAREDLRNLGSLFRLALSYVMTLRSLQMPPETGEPEPHLHEDPEMDYTPTEPGGGLLEERTRINKREVEEKLVPLRRMGPNGPGFDTCPRR